MSEARQKNKSGADEKFPEKMSVRISAAILLFFIAIPISFASLPVAFIPGAVGVFCLLSRRAKYIADSNGLHVRSLFGKKHIRWERIFEIRRTRCGRGCICYGDKNARRFWTLRPRARKAIYFGKEISGFQRLLCLIVERSVNADTDPKVYELYNLPDMRRMKFYGRIAAVMFLVLLAACAWTLNRFIFELDLLTDDSVFIVAGLLVACGLIGTFAAALVNNWDAEDKWSDLGLIYGLFTYSPVLFFLIILQYRLVVMSLVAAAALSALSVIIFWRPALDRTKVAALMVFFIAAGIAGGKMCLYNPSVRRSSIKKIDGFVGTTAGWFPDGRRAWVAGLDVSIIGKGEEDRRAAEKDIVYFIDMYSGDILYRMPAKKVLPLFSFYWSPDGKNMAFLEYPGRKNKRKQILSLIDPDSFEKTELLEKRGIKLHQSGCWKESGDKLVGLYLASESEGECTRSRTVFLLDTASGETTELFRDMGLRAAFRLPDDSVGVMYEHLHEEEKERGRGIRRRQRRYEVGRLDVDTGEVEIIYVSDDDHMEALLSPRGGFILIRTKDGFPLIVDIMEGRELRIDENLAGVGLHRHNAWAPDDSAVLLSVKRGGGKACVIYDIRTGRMTELPAEHINTVSSWCNEFEWFLGYNDAHEFYTPIVLVSAEGARFEVARSGDFLSMIPVDWLAHLSPDGDRVILSDISFSFKRAWGNFDTTVYLIEIER